MVDKVLIVHVGAGILSLLSGLLVFMLPKGGHNHTLTGKIYAVMMFAVFLTATYVSILKENLFLLLIGFFSFYLVHSGIQVNSFRKERIIKPLNKLFTACYALIFCGILLVSIVLALKSNWSMSIILAVFGITGVLQCTKDIRLYFLRKEYSVNALMKDHIGKMSGSYIAAVTAFLVNNVQFLPSLMVWLGPTFIGTIIIVRFSKPYKD